MLVDLDDLTLRLRHEYQPIAGHEDDDYCGVVLNGGRQCGQTQEAHHAPEAVQDYLDQMADRLEDPAQGTGHDVSTWFSLTYSNYLVIPRVLLEHMPTWWQLDVVHRLEQLYAAYSHMDHPDFQVNTCKWVAVDELTAEEAKAAGVTSTLDSVRIPRPPENPTQEEFDAHEKAWVQAHENEQHHDADGNELDRHQRVAVRVPNPYPHYRHGRVEPRGLPDGGGR